MQSFKVLLHHRAACKPGGVLIGLFWTDPDEIDRSFPRTPMRLIAGTGAPGGWMIRRLVPLAERLVSFTGSPSAFMIRWARELVVDRTILVYSPPLHARIGPRLGPVRIFAEQAALWTAAIESLPRESRQSPRVRIFPQGGLTYVPGRNADCHDRGRTARPSTQRYPGASTGTKSATPSGTVPRQAAL